MGARARGVIRSTRKELLDVTSEQGGVVQRAMPDAGPGGRWASRVRAGALVQPTRKKFFECQRAALVVFARTEALPCAKETRADGGDVCGPVEPTDGAGLFVFVLARTQSLPRAEETGADGGNVRGSVEPSNGARLVLFFCARKEVLEDFTALPRVPWSEQRRKVTRDADGRTCA